MQSATDRKKNACRSLSAFSLIGQLGINALSCAAFPAFSNAPYISSTLVNRAQYSLCSGTITFK
jgi:hypothetical protein